MLQHERVVRERKRVQPTLSDVNEMHCTTEKKKTPATKQIANECIFPSEYLGGRLTLRCVAVRCGCRRKQEKKTKGREKNGYRVLDTTAINSGLQL